MKKGLLSIIAGAALIYCGGKKMLTKNIDDLDEEIDELDDDIIENPDSEGEETEESTEE